MNLHIHTEQEVIDRLRHCLPRFGEQLTAERRISELALDSLDTVELLCAIHEEFGAVVRDDDFQPHTRVIDLARQILKQMSLQPA